MNYSALLKIVLLLQEAAHMKSSSSVKNHEIYITTDENA